TQPTTSTSARLSLHDALPICTPFGHGRPFTRRQLEDLVRGAELEPLAWSQALYLPPWPLLAGAAEGVEAVASRVLPGAAGVILRSEEHTSELQSRENLVCRLL